MRKREGGLFRKGMEMESEHEKKNRRDVKEGVGATSKTPLTFNKQSGDMHYSSQSIPDSHQAPGTEQR